MSDEWGPWIEHDGRGCPCVGQFVHAVRLGAIDAMAVAGAECLARGFSPNAYPSAWVWLDEKPQRTNVIRYRIRKPRALEQLREIARNPERDLEDA